MKRVCVVLIPAVLLVSGCTDQASYDAGRRYVTHRQPAFADIGSPYGSDTGIAQACRLYADGGYAHLDGVQDAASFVQGCDDAASEAP